MIGNKPRPMQVFSWRHYRLIQLRIAEGARCCADGMIIVAAGRRVGERPVPKATRQISCL
jgi:hypothetical protein